MDLPNVKQICAVSDCIAKGLEGYIDYWMHNGFWFFDSPEILKDVAQRMKVDLSDSALFYYECYDSQFDETLHRWESFNPEEHFPVKVRYPSGHALIGYDIVSFAAGSAPECSALSCNLFARDVPVNEFCLIGNLDEALRAMKSLSSENAEPGPHRLFSVSTVGSCW